MKFVKYFLQKRSVTILLLLLVLGGGLLSYIKMGKLEDAPFTIKQALVLTPYPGASPSEVQSQVTDVLEESIQSLGELYYLKTENRAGLSKITVYVKKEIRADEMQQLWDKLRRKVNDVQSKLPADAGPSVVNDDFGDVLGVFYGLTGEGYSYRELEDQAKLIKNELLKVKDVAKVEIYGVQPPTIDVILTPSVMARSGITPSDISRAFEAQNRVVDAGGIDAGVNRIRIESTGNFYSLDDIRNLTIVSRTGEHFRLADIAEIKESYQTPPSNKMRINGSPAVGIAISTVPTGNVVNMAEAVKGKIEQFSETMPEGFELQTIYDQGYESAVANQGFILNLIISVVTVVAILLFFIGFKNGILIGSGLVFSIFATLIVMLSQGIALQRMSLAAIIIAMGMLVDNAIVVIESIFRNQEKGVSVKEAVVTGTAEVANAVIASTLTTIVVFLPIVYLHGASGELFKDQAWTVTFSLVSSLFVAILVIPMLYTQLSGKKVKMEEVKSIRITRYSKILRKLVRHRWWVIGMAVLLLVVTGLLTPFIGTEFMPRAESKAFTAVVKMPEGTQMERTAAAVGNLEDLLYTIVGGDSLCTIYSHVGEGSGSENAIFEGENTAMMKIILFPECILSPENVIARFLEEAKNPDGLELSIRQDENSLSSLLGSEGAPIVVEVKGEELDEIAKITGEVKERMQEVDGVYDVVTSIEDGAPEVVISIDRTIAGINNLSVATVIEQLKQQLSGKEAGKMEYRGEMRDIVIKVPDISLGALGSLVIRSGTQEFLLDEIASITHGQAPKEILRRNQSRIGKIMANMDTGKSLDKVAAEVRLAVKDIDLPANYSITVTGEEEKRQESMHSLFFALLIPGVSRKTI